MAAVAVLRADHQLLADFVERVLFR